MENKNKVPSKIIEIETSIKLLEFLKRENTISILFNNLLIQKLYIPSSIVFSLFKKDRKSVV